MTKNLVIVESPAKSRTLKKFLGKDFQIEASLGHIRDLKKKAMGLGENFEPQYQVLAEKKEVVQKLRKAAKNADTIYLAPDPDREGEAIAWHIAEVLDADPERIRRVAFNEITRPAVLRALENPGVIDIRKVEAQTARRVLDRLMGFKLSPLLWDKIKRGLSAGRVQSVALKMVCDRQTTIDAFVPVEYWNLAALLEAAEPPPFTAKLHKIDGKKAVVNNGETAGEIVAALEAGKFVVDTIERKESKQRPSPPFITSRLQQEASRRFGFSVKRTMGVAQGLYEGKTIGSRGSIGLITYMRTDSTRVADEALEAVREFIGKTYGAEKMPAKPIQYRSKKGAQDAHEAIRPTTFDLPPSAVAAYLKPEDLKLYQLIWDRFVASQMLPAIFDVTRADVANGPYILRATGRIMKSPGFLAVYREVKGDESKPEDDKDAILPPLAEGDVLKLGKLDSEQKFTQPPAQFSEAMLVRALEDNGIGRPSTYASILSTLSDRSYVEREKRRFRPTILGKMVNYMLQRGFSDIINETYTASLEEQLDRIEDGKLDWRDALHEFDAKFNKDLEAAGADLPDIKREGFPTDEICPDDGGKIVLRVGRYGSFYGCANYPECRYTRDPEDKPGEAEGETAEEVPPCEKCGEPMVQRRSRYGSFLGCSAYPECKNIRRTGPERAEPKGMGIKCPECKEGEIQEKRSRRGKIFYSCGRYPDCKYALWNKPIERKCPKCDAPFVLEKTTKKKGTHLLCNEEGCDFEESVEAVEETEEATDGATEQASA